jgi:effector-binding domain-containing protein
MKLLKIIGMALGILVAVVVVVVALLSPTSHMERSIVIARSPAAVYEELISLKNFNEWSPWQKKDPNAKTVYEGPAAGVGAKMSWEGDPKTVGTGSQWIAEAEENKRVKSGLEFSGFDGEFSAEFILEPIDGGTKVTWTYDGDVSGTGIVNTSMGKIFGTMVDNMMGPDYEQGLKDLKERVESKPDITIAISLADLPAMSYVGISTRMGNQDPDAISAQMAKSYEELTTALASSKVEMAGAPFAFFPVFEETAMEMVCALPVAAGARVSGKYTVAQLPATKAVKAIHLGSYDNLEDSHSQVNQFIQYKKLEIAGAPMEVYLTDPMAEKDTAKWVTEIYYPIKN